MKQELNQRCSYSSRPDNLVKGRDIRIHNQTHIGNQRRKKKKFFLISSFLKVHSVHLIGIFPFQKEISQKHRNARVIVFSCNIKS